MLKFRKERIYYEHEKNEKNFSFGVFLLTIFPAYSEGKFNLKFGSDMATSFALRPFLYSYPSMPSLYFNIGGSIPIWQLKKGSLGLDFGTELWMPDSPIMVADNPSANNKEADPIDSFKAYLGVTYFLPL